MMTATKPLTPVSEDKIVRETQQAFDECQMKLAQFQNRVSRYKPVMDPRDRATTLRSFTDDDVLEAQAGWEEALRDLSFCELEIRSLTTKLNQAKRDAVLERVAPLRQKLRIATKHLYERVAEASKANSAVLAVYQEARTVLGESQHEIPNLSWADLLSATECDRNTESAIDFRKRKLLKDGWL